MTQYMTSTTTFFKAECDQVDGLSNDSVNVGVNMDVV